MTRMLRNEEFKAASGFNTPRAAGALPSAQHPPALSISERFDLDQDLLILEIRNDGSNEAVFYLYDGLASSPAVRRYRLMGGKTVSATWPANRYDFHLVGPDGLYRRFAGHPASDGAASARLIPARRGVGLILGLSSAEMAWFCLVDETGRRPARRSRVRAGDRPHLRVPVQPDGWYDVSVSRVGGAFRRRFAGRVQMT